MLLMVDQQKVRLAAQLGQLLDLHLERVIRRYKPEGQMGSYEEKMRRAREVVPNLRAAIETDMDKIIARGEELDKKRTQAALAHHKALDADYDSLDGFEHDIDEFSNAVRPLNGGNAGGNVVATDTKTEAGDTPSGTFPKA